VSPREPINLDDFEALAREKLPAMAFEYYLGGAGDELTLRDNRAAWGRFKLLHRVLVDVSKRDLATQVLGQRLSFPVLVAPTAFHGLAHPEAELATARAAGAAGTVMCLSSLSNSAVEEVTKATAQPVWFQLYVYRDRGATEALVARVREAGCKALVLTVDAPLIGRRERDVRNRFHLPEGLVAKNLVSMGYGEVPEVPGGSGLAGYVASLLDQGLSWKDVEWLRQKSGLPVLLKGVVRVDDARRAVDHGAAGLVVSNHGGRQLDTCVPTAEVLGPIAEAVGDRLDVLVDGGIRRGTDVLKALALGAKAVLLGRPVLWGLAAGGEGGVTEVLEMLRRELDLAMALAGCPSIRDITRDLVVGPNHG
jgi:4-hydroxymandelate oxidase